MPRRTQTVTVTLHPAQAAYRASDALLRGYVGGVGSGKSWAGCYDLLRRALPGRLYACTAPTYPMLRDATLRTFTDLARRLSFLRDWSASDMAARLGNGAEVLFRSTDNPDRLRGPNLSGCFMDEASLSDRDALTVLLGRLREGGGLGWLGCAFTPRGRNHWTYEVFGTPGRPDTALFHSRTADNPFLHPDFAAKLAAQYGPGLLARQELEGLFVSLEGAEWPPEYFPDSLWFDHWPDSLVARTLALDPSKGRDARTGDYAAFALLGLDTAGGLWCEADLARGRSAEWLAHQAVDHCVAFRPDAFAIECNQFQQLFAVLIGHAARERGVPVPVVELNNSVPKSVRLRRLGPYLHRRQLRFRDTPGTRLLVQQLQEFPEGEHDDGPDSVEMALRLLLDLAAQADPGSGQTVYRP